MLQMFNLQAQKREWVYYHIIKISRRAKCSGILTRQLCFMISLNYYRWNNQIN